MIEIARGKSETGLQILRLEIGHLLKDRFGRQTSCEEIDDIADADAHPTHTRSTAALLGIDRDSFGELIHAPSITTGGCGIALTRRRAGGATMSG